MIELCKKKILGFRKLGGFWMEQISIVVKSLKIRAISIVTYAI
jgi:hypothetical protein